MTALFVVLLVCVAAANGGNDVCKGVATLAGTGLTRYATAIRWGTVTTLAGALLSAWIASDMTELFSAGVVSGQPTMGFAIAVVTATGLWVALAIVFRLPVSTTQALVGALVGGGSVLSTKTVQWASLTSKVLWPLLFSVVAAYLLSAAINQAFTTVRTVRRGRSPQSTGRSPAAHVAAPDTAATTTPLMGTVATKQSGALLAAVHVWSSGATSFARGLNDTPKLVAAGSFALVPAGMTILEITLIVAAAMAAGALVAGRRLALRLGEEVVRMSHHEGLRANLVTAVLVGAGAEAALPMSTTQVSTSAIAGSAGFHVARVNLRAVREFVFGWAVTPLVTATTAAALSLLIA